MLSARRIYQEIRDHDETYRLFLSVAAKGEAQGGWENDRIARLTRDPELSAKVARHGRDEEKHGRIFAGLLKKRGLDPVAVPFDLDYTLRLERRGIGLSHERLREERPLSDEELLAYLIHSRVTEQRAAEEVALQRRIFGDDRELGPAMRVIAEDEANHLSYCHEELLAFERRGHGSTIRRMLRRYALEEIRTYRDVSIGVMTRMGTVLGWPRWKTAVLRVGIHAIYAIERLFTWRRMARLRPPERPGAMSA